MSHPVFVAAVLSALTALAPKARHAAFESPADTTARYEAAAEQIAAAAEARPLGRGPSAARHAAALVLGALVHETGFDARVDRNACPTGMCPRGAVCVMQIEMGARDRTPEGWSRADIAADREKCIRHGLRLLTATWWACRGPADARRKPEHRLGGYTSGKCDEGLKESAEIWQIAQRASALLNAYRPPLQLPPSALGSELAEPRRPRWIVTYLGP